MIIKDFKLYNKCKFKRLAIKSLENTPKDPLLDDEKIREVIRLWTKVNGVVGLTYNAPENSLTDIFRNEISFNEMLGLEDGCFYTTKELCGEEEE